MSSINNFPLVQSYKPIEICLLIFGYSYNIDNQHKCMLLSNYTVQAVWLITSMYLYINAQINPSYEAFASNPLLYITNRVQLFAKIFTFILMFVNNFFYKTHIQNLFRLLYSIDNKFLQCKIWFNYTENRRKLLIWILVCATMSTSLWGFTNIAFANNVELNWISFCVFITPMITPFMINLQLIFYANICWEIKLRFDRVNALLITGSGVFDHEFRNILIISKLFMELNDCIRLINNGWGYASLGILGVPFISVTSNLFVIFYFVAYTPENERIWERSPVYCIAFWLVYQTIQVIVTLIICNKTTVASQQTRVLFSRLYAGHKQLERDGVDADLITLQFQHQAAHFTAYGFFNIDNQLIFSMISAITTYLVILLQFDAGSNLSDSFTISVYKS